MSNAAIIALGTLLASPALALMVAVACWIDKKKEP